MTLLAIASAAPVICDGATAVRLLDDANIPPERVPVIQPNLLPGLAREQATRDVADAIDRLCASQADLSLAPAERWESADGAAYSFVLTRSAMEGCALVGDGLVLTVGTRPGEPLRYGVRSRSTTTVTPIGACPGVAGRHRDERTLAGADGPVRLVHAVDRVDDAPDASRLVVRRATEHGWREQVLLDPAPGRLLDPSAGGPRVTLLGTGSETWIVAHADRDVDADGCRARPGQTVWRWDGVSWQPTSGRAALALLAERGAWRLAGEDGWLLVLDQDIEADEVVIASRARRLERRLAEPLTLIESALFPGLNPGFFVIAPSPWPTREEAEQARRAASRRAGTYVKRAWTAPDPCGD